jgi:bacillithiol biosynthesis deacetylase BshB1
MKKVDLLVFGAHPDDIELGAGGMVAKEVSLGKRVGLVDLTQGELGTRGSASLRREEAYNALKILGADFRENMCLADGFFKNDKETQLKVIEVIRKYQPEIVVCNAVEDRHIDHGRASQLLSDSCFLSGLKKIETSDSDGNQQAPWRPKAVYHYIQWKDIRPDVLVDIGDFIEAKIESVKAYKSQFYDPNSKEPTTPISSKAFLDSISFRASDLGRMIGVKYAEGFTVERYMGVNSLFDLK